MKESRLNIRLSDDRMERLRAIAKSRNKTVTELVEAWIDGLKTKSYLSFRTKYSEDSYLEREL